MKKLIFLLIFLTAGFMFNSVYGQARLLYIIGGDSMYIELPEGNPKYIFKTDTFKMPGIYIEAEGIGKADSAFYADSANYLRKYYAVKDSSVYISEEEGNDLTGIGTLLNPYATIDHIISLMDDFYPYNFDIILDSGTYHISKESFYRLLEIQTLGFIEIRILGYKKPFVTLTGLSQNPTNQYIYDVTNTLIPGELEGMFIDANNDNPIAENGVNWIMTPESQNGNVGTSVVELKSTLIIDDNDHTVFNYMVQYGRGGIAIENVIFRTAATNKTLRFGVVNTFGKFEFRGCKFLNDKALFCNVFPEQCYFQTSKGIQAFRYSLVLTRCVIKGNNSGGQVALSIKDYGDIPLNNLIIKDYDIGISSNGYSGSITRSGNGTGYSIGFSDVNTCFSFENNLKFVAADFINIYLDTVNYFIETLDTADCQGIFRLSQIKGTTPTLGWYENDNGYRSKPENNYYVFINGLDVLKGNSTLSSGTVTVNTPNIQTNSNIRLTPQNLGTAQGFLYITNIVAGTSFDISSSNASDDRQIFWELIE